MKNTGGSSTFDLDFEETIYLDGIYKRKKTLRNKSKSWRKRKKYYIKNYLI
jgi:hypothetical protein